MDLMNKLVIWCGLVDQDGSHEQVGNLVVWWIRMDLMNKLVIWCGLVDQDGSHEQVGNLVWSGGSGWIS